MLMKHSFKGLKCLGSNFNKVLNKSFAAAAKPESSISLRFHELYVKELERIEKNS